MVTLADWGNITVKVVPFSPLSTEMLPPCCSTMRRTIDKPSHFLQPGDPAVARRDTSFQKCVASLAPGCPRRYPSPGFQSSASPRDENQHVDAAVQDGQVDQREIGLPFK